MAARKLIILRVKPKTREKVHGSSWKVAYADFVTALMAFFLLMWMLAMVAPAKRAEVARYFKEYNLVGKGSPGAIQTQGSVARGEPESPAEPIPASEQLRQDLAQIINARLGDLRDQVWVDTFEAGVRVQVVDKQGRLMFQLGSAKLTEDAKRALKVIAESIKGLENRIAIEGHTDALNYSTTKYTNWELSTARASEARQELERHGLDPDRLIKVAGYAAVDPLIRANPYAPQNRRISILIYDKKDAGPLEDEKLFIHRRGKDKDQESSVERRTQSPGPPFSNHDSIFNKE